MNKIATLNFKYGLNIELDSCKLYDAEVAAIIYRLCEKLDEREIRKDKIR